MLLIYRYNERMAQHAVHKIAKVGPAARLIQFLDRGRNKLKQHLGHYAYQTG